VISGGNVNEYELMTVFHPRLNADETTAAIAAVEAQIVANGGEMLSTDVWGRRRLAYPIKGYLEGTYTLMTMKMPAEAAAPVERWLRISEASLRHLLIRGIIPFEPQSRGRDGGGYGRDDDGRDDRDDRDDREDRRDRGDRDDAGDGGDDRDEPAEG